MHATQTMIRAAAVSGLLALSAGLPQVHGDTPAPLDPLRDNLRLDLGFADLAVGQPIVTIEVFDGSNSLGPRVANQFLLDTGATGVFAAGGAFYNFGDLTLDQLLDLLGDPSSAAGLVTNAVQELKAAGMVVSGAVGELGVGGIQVVEVSAPYDITVSYGGQQQHALNGVKMLVNGDADFGQFAGIVGMPAMLGKVTTLDMSGWGGPLGPAPAFDLSNIDDFIDSLDSFSSDTGIAVTLGDSLPPAADPARRLSVDLFYKSFEYDPADLGGTGLSFSEPTSAPLPFATAEFKKPGVHAVSTEVLIDTGAQLSIISSDIAIALGLDRNGDGSIDELDLNPLDFNEDLITVSGASGQETAPLMLVEDILLPTREGPVLAFSGYLLILDIAAEIPAILGSDIITSGWSDQLLAALGLLDPGVTADPGNFQRVHFDFRNDTTGRMVFDLTHQVPEPGVLVLIAAGAALMMPGRRRRHRRAGADSPR